MKSLADRILAIQLKTEVIEVPEWSTKIGITEMDAGQRIKFGEDAKKQPALAMVRLLISSAFDPDTLKPVFEQAHQDALVKQSGAVIDRIITEICRISGLTQGATESAEKN
jgi:hypothetical protein